MEMIDALKLTVYMSDADRSGRRPLYRALVELLHREGIAGATVLRGIEGFGADRRIHTIKIEVLAMDLPVVVTAIDRADKIESELPAVQAMAGRKLVTLEPVTATRFYERDDMQSRT